MSSRFRRPPALRRLPAATSLLVAAFLPAAACGQEVSMIRLPAPALDGGAPLSTVLAGRRSVREFAGEALRLPELAQLLWAAQGVTEPGPAPAGFSWEWRGGLRTAPSAGALHPLELYVAVTAVDGLEPGLYHYEPLEHALTRVGDCAPPRLATAALGQRAVSDAAAVVVVTAVHERTAAKYGERAMRYVDMEAGAAAENLLLQAEALSLGAVYVGAFRDEAVIEVLELPEAQAPLVLLPVGRPVGS